MSIILVSDLSALADEAADIAGAICARLGVELKLVHCGRTSRAAPTAQDQLGASAARVRARHGIPVESIVRDAPACESVLDVARSSGARIVFIPGSAALETELEDLQRDSAVPLLVVRESASLHAWVAGERRLRVLVAAEFGPSTRAAAAFAARLRDVSACDIVIAHIAWPPEEQARLGVRGPVPLDSLRPEVAEPLERDLRDWIGSLPGPGDTTFAVLPGWGRVDTHVALFATQWNADLVVAGARRRRGAARIWHGSVSRGLIRQAQGNAALVPLDRDTVAREIRNCRSVVIATDLSDASARAVPFGYGLLHQGGVAHLLHVVGADEIEPADLRARLASLVPAGARARGITTEVAVVHEADVARAICHLAAQVGADGICMATRGRSAVASLVLGSAAQGVVRESEVPVVLVPPARGG